MSKSKTFFCYHCNINTKTKDYFDNPAFLADSVILCPQCGRKNWEVEKPKIKDMILSMTFSEKFLLAMICYGAFVFGLLISLFISTVFFS